MFPISLPSPHCHSLKYFIISTPPPFEFIKFFVIIMGKLKGILRTLKSICRRLVFKVIYTIYLWSLDPTELSYQGSRYVEYPFVIENLSLPENSKVLLVGCADDPLSTILPTLGYKVYGLDLKPVYIKYPNFKFVRGDIRKTRFPSNHFDAVVAVSAIEHVGVIDSDYEGDKKALKEIMRILKPNGIILVTIPVVAKPLMTEYSRFYDITLLNALFSGFNVLKKSIFMRDEQGYWIKSLEEQKNGFYGVALVSALKK